jgi:hypothetical protein
MVVSRETAFGGHYMNKVNFVFVVVLAILVAGCASNQPNPDYIGDYGPQDLGKVVYNTIPQGKNELTSKEISLQFLPRLNLVLLQYRAGVNSIVVRLTQKNREDLSVAMSKYIDEYKRGSLSEKNNKAKGYFGSTTGKLEWGLLGSSYVAKVMYRFEYQLIESEKPYFVIANRTEKQIDADEKVLEKGADSPAVRLAISPIQCQELIESIKQEHLVSIVKELDAEAQKFDIKDEKAKTEPQGDGNTTTEEKKLF